MQTQSAPPAVPGSASEIGAALERMIDEFQRAPAIYHPSRFWASINAKHLDWLSHDGLRNFKRTLNHSYFQFHISSRSDHFQHALKRFLRLALRKPWLLRYLVQGRIGEIRGKTVFNEQYRRSARQRYLYKLYVLALFALVSEDDPFGLFARLDEPMVGEPQVVELGARRITQDLCNSYGEYAFIRRTLGAAFDGIRSLAEIGAGYGRLMYVFQALHPTTRKLVVDIPPALLVSEWYLRRVFPDVPARGYLDAPEPAQGAGGEPVLAFALPHALEAREDKSLDLVINVSSFHEMTFDQIDRYFEVIDRKARYLYIKQWFSWKNPEDDQVVSILSYPVRRNWKLLDLRLNPLNPRFFEALFELP